MSAPATAGQVPQAGSSSIEKPDYWWYRARGWLLPSVLSPSVGRAERVLDVGSADGPSAAWLPGRICLDIDPRGLKPGNVCASADRLPFADETFDVVSAFDVVEHFADDVGMLTELRRVLRPGGTLLLSVPAYQWAWSAFDVRAGHHRRYTMRRLRRVVRRAGFRVDRATYAFFLTLPFFVASRLLVKTGRAPADVPTVPGVVERVLLALCRIEEVLVRRLPLPAGSSVLLAAKR